MFGTLILRELTEMVEVAGVWGRRRRVAGETGVAFRASMAVA